MEAEGPAAGEGVGGTTLGVEGCGRGVERDIGEVVIEL